MRRSIRIFPWILLAALAAGCERGVATCEALLVTDAWVREAPPNMDTAAGYLTVFNSGSGPVVVTGASSPDFGHVMMHATEQTDGRMRMRPMDRVVLQAGGKHVFRPGGDHLMLMSPRGAFVAGDQVRLELQCRAGEPRGVTAPVRRDSPPDAPPDN